MDLVKKSIIRKLFLYLAVIGVVVFGFAYYFYFSVEEVVVPFYVAISFFVLVSFFMLWRYYYDAVRPLRRITTEMEYVLTNKPYNKIYTKRVDEIGVIAYFFNQITKGIGSVSGKILERDRMMDELTIAAQIQRDILPKESINVPGLQIVAKSRPATEVGGDSFDFIDSGNKSYIYLGDVTGHGVPAGLIMTMVNGFVHVFADSLGSAKEIMINVNKYIKQRIQKAMFMTMVMLSWDQKEHKLSYVGAGHEHILVYRAATGEVDSILTGGIALGMVPDNASNVEEKEILLEDGDFVVLYSDGITEARNTNGEQFGLENIKKSLVDYAPQYSAEGVNYHIAKDVSNFMKGAEQLDDMTLIVMKRDDAVDVNASAKNASTDWD